MDHSKVPFLASYNYSPWHRHAWSVLMNEDHSLYVENKVPKPTDDEKKIQN